MADDTSSQLSSRRDNRFLWSSGVLGFAKTKPAIQFTAIRRSVEMRHTGAATLHSGRGLETHRSDNPATSTTRIAPANVKIKIDERSTEK